MPSKKISALISKQEAAQLAGVSTTTISRLTASGKVTSFRVGARRLYRPDLIVSEVLAAGARGPGVGVPA